jgi:hypothetical protein
VSFSNVIVVNSTTITATLKVAATATTGSGLPIAVSNNSTAGYGRAAAGLLTIS